MDVAFPHLGETLSLLAALVWAFAVVLFPRQLGLPGRGGATPAAVEATAAP